MRTAAWALVVAATVGLPRVGLAVGENELVSLINARRAEMRGCSGVREAAAGPLAPSPSLARVDAAAAGGDLGKALIAAGYSAATATTIVLSGAGEAQAAVRMVEEQHCDVVRNPRYVEIGVMRTGSTWRINLAAPLLAGDLGDWREAGQAVLRLVNEARRRGGVCGTRRFAAAAPLAWSDSLAAAALAHRQDMAAHDYFDHVDRRGSAVAERARRHGYPWRVIGENIAAGQGAPQQVVAGWLASPGHCANVLSPDFREMATAYALNPQAAMEIYWTQVFGSR
ncbi:MAG: CAP domain-containing protein [Caldimonas sp.]